jgi:hypothetical protein
MQKDAPFILAISRVDMGKHIPAPVPREGATPAHSQSFVQPTPPREEVAYSIEGFLEGSFAWQPSSPLERGNKEIKACSFGQDKGGQRHRTRIVLTPPGQAPQSLCFSVALFVPTPTYQTVWYVSEGGDVLESWAKARQLQIFWTVGHIP